MKLYDLTVITKNQKDQGVVTEAIESQNGKIVADKSLGDKSFAYPIEKQTEGNYHQYKIELDSEESEKLNHNLSSNQLIIRHLLTKTKSSQFITFQPESSKFTREDKKEYRPPQKTTTEDKTDSKQKSTPKPEKVDTPVKATKEDKKTQEDRKKVLDEKLQELLNE